MTALPNFSGEADAVFSGDGRYRYSLTRTWEPERGRVLFVMLNPSTADAHTPDATVRRCVAFARAWHFGSLEVVNLFAWKATDPAELSRVTDPVGPDNNRYIASAANRAQRVVAAWGARAATEWSLCQRPLLVWSTLTRVADLYAIRLTREGHPEHPLYLPRTLEPKLWHPRRT